MQLTAGPVSPYRLRCCWSYDPIILSRLVVGVSAGICSFALTADQNRALLCGESLLLSAHLVLTKTNAYYCNRCIKKSSSFWKVKILITPKIAGIIVSQVFYFPSLRTRIVIHGRGCCASIRAITVMTSVDAEVIPQGPAVGSRINR